MPDLLRYGLLCLVVLMSNFQEGVTGFGCTVLALPFAIMLLGYGGHDGLEPSKHVLVLLAWVLNLGIVVLARKRIVWREYWYIVVLVGLAMPVGIWMADTLEEKPLKVLLALFMLGIGAHGLVTLAASASGLAKISPRTRMLVSTFLPLSGIIHGAFFSGGPLVVVYATRVLGDKSVFRVTLSLVYLTLNSLLICKLASEGAFQVRELHLAAMCLPFTLLGLFLGNYAHHRMDYMSFKRMVYGVLCAAGVALAWMSLSS